MTDAVKHLKSEAASLSRAERADLAHYLLESLELEEECDDAAWQAEIARRVAEVRAGTAKGRPIEDVLAELRG